MGGINRLFFKSDRIYRHRLLRINYTTYDVRRGQDIINPRTSHRDVMVLRDDSEDPEVGKELADSQRYLYARVLGIFHANVVYMDPGSQNYQPRRMEFLWVRWFQPYSSVTWESRRLDTIKFRPVNDAYAFGFLDPADVIRACHILPRTPLEKVHQKVGMSRLAADKEDWKY